MAIQGHSGHFMSVNPEDDSIVAQSRKAGENEMVIMRIQNEKVADDDDTPVEEKGSIRDIEINYV